MKVTEVRITPGFALNRDIIFAQGPIVWEYDDYETAFRLLKQTYTNIIKSASEAYFLALLTPIYST